jgi:hypothetical protein
MRTATATAALVGERAYSGRLGKDRSACQSRHSLRSGVFLDSFRGGGDAKAEFAERFASKILLVCPHNAWLSPDRISITCSPSFATKGRRRHLYRGFPFLDRTAELPAMQA